VRESAVLQHDNRLVALLVPRNPGEPPDPARLIGEVSRTLPSYQQPTEAALSAEPLPRTRLGKLRRHLLPELFEQTRGGHMEAQAGPLPPEQMDSTTRELLEDEAARATWGLLSTRYRGRRITPETSLGGELGVDSMEWLDLGLEIERQAGVELDPGQLEAIETVGELLEAVAAARPGTADAEARARPRVAENARWLRPLPPAAALVAGTLYRLERRLMRRLFSLSVEGAPPPGQCIFVPNHASYLDPFLLAATLEPARFPRVFWAGWTGVAFSNPLVRGLSRLAQAIPVDEHSARAALALAGGVLERGHDLVWFPEGGRSADGRLRPFREGIGRLLQAHAVPVVPVAIDGAFEAWPPGRMLPRRRPVRVSFGTAVSVEKLEREGGGETPAQRITNALERQVRALLDTRGPPGQ
jgi:long-chain acyl-CoA synthetase